MAKQQFPHKIIWLASYPKSGNTWFRAFLTALLNDGEVEINSMKTDGIFSSREIFEMMSDIDSRDLYDDEVKLMLPDVYRQLAKERKQTSIVKVHDAYSYNMEGQPVIPGDVTHCAIYIIRNPLDIAGSLANHNNSTLDEAVDLMNNEYGYLARQKNNLNVNPQLPQLMYDWSRHVKSWTTLPDFPVHILRYEDMLTDSFNTFKTAVEKIGWAYTDEQIKQAVESSSFEKLSSQEKSKGFSEKNRKSTVFFRKGKIDGWKEEMNDDQVTKIKRQHYEVMLEHAYKQI